MNDYISSLAHSRLPNDYWDYLIIDSGFKYNHIPHNLTQHAPISLWQSNFTFPPHFSLPHSWDICRHKWKQNDHHDRDWYVFCTISIVFTWKSCISITIEKPHAVTMIFNPTNPPLIHHSFLDLHQTIPTKPHTHSLSKQKHGLLILYRKWNATLMPSYVTKHVANTSNNSMKTTS